MVGWIRGRERKKRGNNNVERKTELFSVVPVVLHIERGTFSNRNACAPKIFSNVRVNENNVTIEIVFYRYCCGLEIFLIIFGA